MLRHGELLLRVDYRCLDPYMRTRMDNRKSDAPWVAIGGVMAGENVATETLPITRNLP